jgi:very-short-patch-repair endonuclease
VTDEDRRAKVEESRHDLVGTTARLVQFLRELVRTGHPTVKDLDKYDEHRWLEDLPSSLFEMLVFDAGPGEILFSALPVVSEPPPSLPDDLVGLVAIVDNSAAEEPELRPAPIDDPYPESVYRSFAQWLDAWRVWAENDQTIAPKRDWFDFLTRLARLLDQQDDDYELVLGTGVVSWAPAEDQIRHPMLITRLELAADPATGRVDVRIPSNGVTQICDRTVLGQQPGFDSARAESVRDALRSAPARPLADATKSTMSDWRALSLERAHPYEHVWGPPGPPTPAAEVNFAPVLIFRQRDRASLIDYYDRMLEHLSGPDAVAPIGLAQLVGALEPEDRLAWLELEGAHSGESLGADPLFPLPANAEQRQIIDRLRNDNGVVVQGPPGTGKSHTIANLISALLARGQRVLVTSQKAQALRVLREKLPPEIQRLCVSMTDLSRGGSQELNESVTALSDRYSTYSPATYEQRVRERTSAREAAVADVARLTEQIRVLRESETVIHPPIGPGYEGKKSAIAQRLREHEETCDWVPLPFPSHAPFDAPMSIGEIVELRRLLADSTPERQARAAQDLPALDSVPSAVEVTAAIAAEAAATTIAAEAQSTLSAALDDLSDVDFTFLRPYVDTAHSALHALRLDDLVIAGSNEWAGRALADGLAQREAVVWSQLAQLAPSCDAAQQQLASIGARQVSLPAFEPAGPQSLDAQLLACQALLAHLQAGNEIKKRLRPAVQKAANFVLEGCTIDGIPISNAELLLIAVTAMHVEQACVALSLQWATVGVTVDSDLPVSRRIAQLGDLFRMLTQVQAALASRDGVEAELIRRSIHIPLQTPEEWQAFVDALDAVEARFAAEQATERLNDQGSQLSLRSQHPKAPPELALLARAVLERNATAYESALGALAGAFAEQEEQQHCNELFERLHHAHPVLADLLRETASEPAWDARLGRFADAWAWGLARTYFDGLRQPGLEDRLSGELDDAIARRDRATAELAAEEAWGQCLTRMSAHQEQALRMYQANIADRGAGTGQFADRFAAAAREAMLEARDAVPAWIMPLREVIETIPPDRNSFDVVIIDEASQASIEALFLLWLAPRVIVVGDERQCAPSVVIRGRLQPIFDRLDDYLAAVPEYLRLAFTPKSNLFSLLATRFGSVIRLREHFRCMPEIIGWSSRQFYADAPLVPLKQFGADRLTPLRCVHVPDAYSEGTATRVKNPVEAQAIVDAIKACAADPAYAKKTFGVIVLQGTGQIRLIEDMLNEALPPVEWERRRLRVGSAPDFQGDERHVMFVSMVIAERRPAVTQREWQRRFNVAASRAQEQMWLFHSVTLDLLSPTDLRRSFLAYMLNPPAPAAADAFADLRWDSERRDPFDSMFEQRVFIQLRDRGFSVTPQFEVNGRFIDLVVTGAKGRLAIECDGDYWHSRREDQLNDLDRELDLRRAGWQFWRVRESEFYLGPEAALGSLWDALEARGIQPGDLSELTGEPSVPGVSWEASVLTDEEGLDGLEGDDG